MYRPGGSSGPQDTHDHLQEIQSRNRALREQQQLKDNRSNGSLAVGKSKNQLPKQTTSHTSQIPKASVSSSNTAALRTIYQPSPSNIVRSSKIPPHPSASKPSLSLQQHHHKNVVPSSSSAATTTSTSIDTSFLSPSHNQQNEPTWLKTIEEQHYSESHSSSQRRTKNVSTTTTTTAPTKVPQPHHTQATESNDDDVVVKKPYSTVTNTTTTSSSSSKKKTGWKDFGSTIILATADGGKVRLPKKEDSSSNLYYRNHHNHQQQQEEIHIPEETKDLLIDDTTTVSSPPHLLSRGNPSIDDHQSLPSVSNSLSFQSQIQKIREKAARKSVHHQSSFSHNPHEQSRKSSPPPVRTVTSPNSNNNTSFVPDLLSFMASIAPMENSNTDVSIVVDNNYSLPKNKSCKKGSNRTPNITSTKKLKHQAEIFSASPTVRSTENQSSSPRPTSSAVLVSPSKETQNPQKSPNYHPSSPFTTKINKSDSFDSEPSPSAPPSTNISSPKSLKKNPLSPTKESFMYSIPPPPPPPPVMVATSIPTASLSNHDQSDSFDESNRSVMHVMDPPFSSSSSHLSISPKENITNVIPSPINPKENVSPNITLLRTTHSIVPPLRDDKNNIFAENMKTKNDDNTLSTTTNTSYHHHHHHHPGTFMDDTLTRSTTESFLRTSLNVPKGIITDPLRSSWMPLKFTNDYPSPSVHKTLTPTNVEPERTVLPTKPMMDIQDMVEDDENTNDHNHNNDDNDDDDDDDKNKRNTSGNTSDSFDDQRDNTDIDLRNRMPKYYNTEANATVPFHNTVNNDTFSATQLTLMQSFHPVVPIDDLYVPSAHDPPNLFYPRLPTPLGPTETSTVLTIDRNEDYLHPFTSPTVPSLISPSRSPRIKEYFPIDHGTNNSSHTSYYDTHTINTVPFSSSSSSSSPSYSSSTTGPLSPNGPSVPYFTIPELPTGKGLQIEILSTWGDVHYVGLNGIEIFNKEGKLITFNNLHSSSLFALPYNDINALFRKDSIDPNTTSSSTVTSNQHHTATDPRTLDKLFDGINVTCDDTHSWLAPWSSDFETIKTKNNSVSSSVPAYPTVYITFDEPSVTIAMIRIFNYNKSRIHSYRGVRHVRIRMVTFKDYPLLSPSLIPFAHSEPLTSEVIFDGEIRKAPGRSTTFFHECCETILFTMDSGILGHIEHYDPHAMLLKEEIYRQYHHLHENDELPNITKQYLKLAAFVDSHRPNTTETLLDTDTTTNNNNTLTNSFPSSEKSSSDQLRKKIILAKVSSASNTTGGLLRHTRSRKDKDFVPYHQLHPKPNGTPMNDTLINNNTIDPKRNNDEEDEVNNNQSSIPLPPPPPPLSPFVTLPTLDVDDDYDTGKGSLSPANVSPAVQGHRTKTIPQSTASSSSSSLLTDDSFDSFDSSRSPNQSPNIPKQDNLNDDINSLMQEFRITGTTSATVPSSSPPPRSTTLLSPTATKGKSLPPSFPPPPVSSPSLPSKASSFYTNETFLPTIDQEVYLENLPRGRLLTLKILSTYGDTHYVGLTGIEIYHAVPFSATKGKVRLLNLSSRQVYAQPKDLNSILIQEEIVRLREEMGNNRYSGDYINDYIDNFQQSLHSLPPRDPRTLDKLVNQDNLTTDDSSMWLIPWTSRTVSISSTGNPLYTTDELSRNDTLPTRYTKDTNQHILQIDCLASLYITGIKIYNYNKSIEDSYRGIHHCVLLLDNQTVYLPPQEDLRQIPSVHDLYPIIPLQKAPGTTAYDYGQYLRLTKHKTADNSSVLLTNYFLHPNRSYRTYSAIDLPKYKRNSSSSSSSTLLLPLYPSLALTAKKKGTLSVPSIPLVLPQQDTFETMVHPCGFEYKFIFDCNCGDMYYLGLDSIALYDTLGYRIPVLPHQITAYPSSINDLYHGNNNDDTSLTKNYPSSMDARVPTNFSFLPDTVNYKDTFINTNDDPVPNECILRQDDPNLYYCTRLPASTVALPSSPYPPSRAWLSPLHAPRADHPDRIGNSIIFHFAFPVSISMIRIFNYSKTPSRGAGRVQLWLDSLCIFQGDLQPAPPSSSPPPTDILHPLKPTSSSRAALLPNQQYIPRPCCTLAFTHNSTLLQRDIDLKYIRYCGTSDQDIAYYNDGKLISKLSIKAQYAYNAALEAAKVPHQRPFTAIGVSK